MAKSVDLPGREAQRVLETRVFKEVVDLDWSHAHRMGVMAVPTFMIDQKVIVKGPTLRGVRAVHDD